MVKENLRQGWGLLCVCVCVCGSAAGSPRVEGKEVPAGPCSDLWLKLLLC